VTLPASAQVLSPPPSVTKLSTSRPAPSYLALLTIPPGEAVARTRPRWSYQVFVVRALLETVPFCGSTLYVWLR